MPLPFQSRLWLAYGASLVVLTVAVGQLDRTHDPAPAVAPVAVVAHKSCTTDNLSSDDLRKMLLGDLRAWPDASRIVLIQQPDDSPVQKRAMHIVLQIDPPGYKRQLLASQFRGKELPSIKILSSDDNAIKFVWNVPGALALVDAASVAAYSSRVKVLHIDGKVPGEPGYPLQ